jgi:hypothetical protein
MFYPPRVRSKREKSTKHVPVFYYLVYYLLSIYTFLTPARTLLSPSASKLKTSEFRFPTISHKNYCTSKSEMRISNCFPQSRNFFRSFMWTTLLCSTKFADPQTNLCSSPMRLTQLRKPRDSSSGTRKKRNHNLTRNTSVC